MIDLRGRQLVPAPAAVLADPSGRRARLLARGGFAVAAVFLLWLVGLALAGLGILPAGDIPLGPTLAIGQPPSALKVPPAPQPPSRADLAAARALAPAHGVGLTAAAVHGGASAPGLPSATGRGNRRHSRAPLTTRGSRGSSTPSGAAVGATTPPRRGVGSGSGTTTAPGQTRKQTSPGHTKTSSPGHSGAPPGQGKRTTTTTTSTSPPPGSSGSAHGNGRGHRSP